MKKDLNLKSKSRTPLYVIVLLSCLLGTLIGCTKSGETKTSGSENLAAGFTAPPDASKPFTWWHWMNGHVTKDSITRDLEEMKRVGLGGFALWNTHEGIPKGPVKYGSPEWWELVDHTVNEADRLGLVMEMFNGAGWSATAAPFVTPEKAMQEIAWTEVKISGPGKVSIKLDTPRAALGLERDMKRDPEINKRYYVPREQVEGCFRDLAVFAVPSIPSGQKVWYLEGWRNKAGFGKMIGHVDPDNRTAPADQVIGLNQILDVSSYMNDNGVLEWEAPEGEWTILRIGYQPTARSNHPASWGGKGLEIDKLSSEAMDFYWEHFLERVVETAGDRVGETFRTILIDSYEAGHQNWTHAFPEEFIKSQGYDFLQYLPVVTGRILENVEFTERVLWDYRKVINDLMVENYYGRMAERANEAGLKFAAEPYGSFGNSNDFDTVGKVDIPTCEWWAFDGKRTGRIGEAKQVASAAHLYGRKIVASEAFTGKPDRVFEEHPGAIKSQGDFFMAQGVNRFNFHTWAHDPYSDGPGPGLGLGTYGGHFDSRNTWWPYASAWFEYVSRCQYMLQQGEFIGDVLYYVGEDAPLRSEHFHKEHILTSLPDSYDYAVCNTEILQELIYNEDRLKTRKGSSFQVLVLPESPWMSLDVLQKVKTLLESGAIVCGPKPVSPPGLVSDEERMAFRKLVDTIWGKTDGEVIISNPVGKGMMNWGKPLGNVLTKKDVVPDFSYILETTRELGKTLYPCNGIEFIHRQIGSDEVYFLSNQHEEEKSITARFRVTGKTPEIWYPDSGKMFQLPGIQKTDTHTEVPLHFDTEEAFFVVFRDAKDLGAEETVPWTGDTEIINDLSDGWAAVYNLPDNPLSKNLSRLVSWTELEDDDLKYHSGTAIYKRSFLLNGSLQSKGEYILDLGDVEVIAEVVVNGKKCGIAWKKPYQVNVTDAIQPGENTLEITVANLWVNRILGDQQFPYDLEWTSDTGSTAKGEGLAYIPEWVKNNTQRPETRRKAFYAWKWPHLTPGKELLPSGLQGPVKLVFHKDN